jgi:hypothetical protein
MAADYVSIYRALPAVRRENASTHANESEGAGATALA